MEEALIGGDNISEDKDPTGDKSPNLIAFLNDLCLFLIN